MWPESAIVAQVSKFLERTGLKGKAFTVEEFAAALQEAGLVDATEAFPAGGRLTAGIFVVGGVRVLFYPDPRDCGFLAALQSLGHEAGHMWLKHKLQAATPGTGNEERDPKEEAEAEEFSRAVIEIRGRFERGRDSGTAAGLYFGGLDRAGGMH